MNATDIPRKVGCGQCGKPAIYQQSGVPLCVDCYYRFTVAQTLQFRMNAAMANHAMDQMDAISGIPLSGGRIALPPIPQPPFTLNNIKLDNSVVGAINTGTVKTIDVNLTHLHNAGNDRARDALAKLTEAIASSDALDPKQKNEMAEQVAFLSEQAVAAAKDRKPGVIKATLDALNQGAGAVTAIAGAWNVAEPLVRQIFGL
ncbi:MAG TPA: hypothetical protein VMF32_16870 [Xanthobacteraceae bacterium]|nr:hypothetical protein [Xanthobacteraceae bacterium]HUN38909.1 hypothetical protein [Acetobacteraceae bacterium]